MSPIWLLPKFGQPHLMHVNLSNDCPLVLIIMLSFCLVLVSHPYVHIVCTLLFGKVYFVALCHCGGHSAAFLTVSVMYYLVCFCVQSIVLFDIVSYHWRFWFRSILLRLPSCA